jgi:hypothetical protein
MKRFLANMVCAFKRSRKALSPPSPRAHLAVESLEDRLVLSQTALHPAVVLNPLGGTSPLFVDEAADGNGQVSSYAVHHVA